MEKLSTNILHLRGNNHFLQRMKTIFQKSKLTADPPTPTIWTRIVKAGERGAIYLWSWKRGVGWGGGTLSYVTKRYFESNITTVKQINGASAETPTGRNHILSS